MKKESVMNNPEKWVLYTYRFNNARMIAHAPRLSALIAWVAEYFDYGLRDLTIVEYK